MATLAPSVTLEDIKPVSFQPLFVERSELEQKQASHAFCTAVQYDGRSPAALRNSHMPPTSAPGMNGATPARSSPGLGSPCHIRPRNGPNPPTSEAGLGSPLPHLHRDWAHPCCATASRTAIGFRYSL
jgi:hypothetical protein